MTTHWWHQVGSKHGNVHTGCNVAKIEWHMCNSKPSKYVNPAPALVMIEHCGSLTTVLGHVLSNALCAEAMFYFSNGNRCLMLCRTEPFVCHRACRNRGVVFEAVCSILTSLKCFKPKGNGAQVWRYALQGLTPLSW